MSLNILLVDDDDQGRRYTASFLRKLGHVVVEAANGHAAQELFSSGDFHLVLTDIRMPRMSGLELLRTIHSFPGGRDVHVVLFTAYSDVDSAIEALRAGAYDYLLKPINVKELVALLERVAEHLALKRENEALTLRFEEAVNAATGETRQELSRLKEAYLQVVGLGRIGIFSEVLKQVFEHARILHAERYIPVLIDGETGTGKELVARYIHYGEEPVTAPFIDLNCAALAPNVFESELFGYEAGAFTGGLPKGKKGKLDLAQGGTLFLDEITEMPGEIQAKLLRVIQEKEFYRVGGLRSVKMRSECWPKLSTR